MINANLWYFFQPKIFYHFKKSTPSISFTYFGAILIGDNQTFCFTLFRRTPMYILFVFFFFLM